jgi:hypothetical protein
VWVHDDRYVIDELLGHQGRVVVCHTGAPRAGGARGAAPVIGRLALNQTVPEKVRGGMMLVSAVWPFGATQATLTMSPNWAPVTSR